MTTRHSLLLLVLGLGIWIAGTIYYEFRGPTVLETTSLQYWVNFILSPAVSALTCVLILRGLQIPTAAWAPAALLLALPGMTGEAILLSHFEKWMPRLQSASGARYGAFLFAAYALVLGIAEVVTLRAAP